MDSLRRRSLGIDELHANHFVVSVNKYGFFLCLKGSARILLGEEIYRLSPGSLCIYTPNTFFQILERSADLDGILEEDAVDAYYPVVSSIDIHRRLQIRRSPCVDLSTSQSRSIVRLVEVLDGEENEQCLQHLRYAVCLKVLEAYFSNKPAQAMPQSHDDVVLNRFIVSVYENCHTQRMVQWYADEQHLSPYYFSSIIKERSGLTAMQWIENVTMTFARQYLSCSDLSIKQIAERMNFPDQSAFGRYFKRCSGTSPSAFRLHPHPH